MATDFLPLLLGGQSNGANDFVDLISAMQRKLSLAGMDLIYLALNGGLLSRDYLKLPDDFTRRVREIWPQPALVQGLGENGHGFRLIAAVQEWPLRVTSNFGSRPIPALRARFGSASSF